MQEIIRAPPEVNLAPLRRNARFVRFRLKFGVSPIFEEIPNAQTGLRIRRLQKECKNNDLKSIQFCKKNRTDLLLFVHRTFILLRCGKPLAADALLGCFLPRLGPLVATQAASFLFVFAVVICR